MVNATKPGTITESNAYKLILFGILLHGPLKSLEFIDNSFNGVYRLAFRLAVIRKLQCGEGYTGG